MLRYVHFRMSDKGDFSSLGLTLEWLLNLRIMISIRLYSFTQCLYKSVFVYSNLYWFPFWLIKQTNTSCSPNKISKHQCSCPHTSTSTPTVWLLLLPLVILLLLNSFSWSILWRWFTSLHGEYKTQAMLVHNISVTLLEIE